MPFVQDFAVTKLVRAIASLSLSLILGHGVRQHWFAVFLTLSVKVRKSSSVALSIPLAPTLLVNLGWVVLCQLGADCLRFFWSQVRYALGSQPCHRPGQCLFSMSPTAAAVFWPLSSSSAVPSALLGFVSCCLISSASISPFLSSSAQFPVFARASLSPTNLCASCLICAVSATTSESFFVAFCDLFPFWCWWQQAWQKEQEELLRVIRDVSLLSPYGFPYFRVACLPLQFSVSLGVRLRW